MQTKFLTEEERREGTSRLYKFQTFNGLGYNFMGETPVYLLAIHYGASNVELGYISSAIYLSGIILVFLPRLLAGRNMISVQASAWFLRGLFVLLYLLLFFMEGRPAVLLILTVYTLFCSARMVGVVIWNPLVRMVTTSQNRGEVLSMGNIYNQSASVAAKMVSFIITSFRFLSGVTGLLLLQIVGVIFNSTASWQLKKTPCRESVEYEKGRNLFVILGESLSRRDRAIPLVQKWFFVAAMVVNSLTIVFVRKEAGFDSNFVFLFTMSIALANILSGVFCKTFADRIGSRPLLLGMDILLVLSYGVWMLLPLSSVGSIAVPLYFVLGFFTNFFLLTTNVLLDRVVVNSMPEKDNFGYNAMNNFVMALFSLIAGVAGGILIDLGQNSAAALPNSYSYLFFAAMILALLLVILGLFLEEKGSLSPREALSIFFSFEGLRAYNYIGKLNTTDDPLKKKTVIMSITQNNAPIATEEMRSIIASPLSSVKGEVIKSLFNNPRPELLDVLMREAADSSSYHQLKAIFALGAYENQPGSEALLTDLLDSADPSVRSTAAKSLGRVGNRDSLDRVRALSRESREAWEKINYLIALKNMDGKGEIFARTFEISRSGGDGIFRQTYYSLTADLLDMTPPLSEIYASKNMQTGAGLRLFLEQTRDVGDFYAKHRELKRWFGDGDWQAIGRFCIDSLKHSAQGTEDRATPHRYLLSAVMKECGEKVPSYDDALAVLYFTYQIIRDGEKGN